MSSEKRVPVGQVLILQDEFRKVASRPNQALGLVTRAQMMIRLLDEVLMWRETAGEETEDA